MLEKHMYNDFIETLNILWEKKLIVLGILLFDFLFFIGLIIINMQIFMAASQDLIKIQSIFQDQNKKLTDAEFANINKILMKDPEFVDLYNNVKRFLLIFLTLLFSLFFILQGAAWALSHLVFHKFKLHLFAGKFLISSIISFLLLFISGQLIIKSKILGIIFLILSFYFIFLLNSLLNQKNIFNKILALIKEKNVIITFATGFLLILITGLDMFWLFNYNFYAGIASSLLLILSLTFLRIHIIKNVKS